eukprot:gene2476-4811_t
MHSKNNTLVSNKTSKKRREQNNRNIEICQEYKLRDNISLPGNNMNQMMMQFQCGECRSPFAVARTPTQQTVLAVCPTCNSTNRVNIGPASYQPVIAQPVVNQNYIPVQSPNMYNQSMSKPIASGRHKAVLVGINYMGSRGELRGCINDVENIRRLLTQQYGWASGCIHVLVDNGTTQMPTRANILRELRWLAEDAKPGDVFFFHYSGHGAQTEDPHGLEEDGMNETLLPVDFKSAGMITDDEIASIIVRPLPNGCRLTAVMDCCHSGTGLDLPFEWRGNGWREETNPFHCAADVQMFSGCCDDQTSADVASAYTRPGGAMTTALCEALRQNPAPTYSELMSSLHRHMTRGGFDQRPNLTSSQRFDANRVFLLDDIMANTNPSLGRTFRRKFPPNPRQVNDPIMADMLGVAVVGVAAVVAADCCFSLLFDL